MQTAHRLIDERYEILRPLGAGGMASVYQALDTRLGRHVAIKILSPAHADDPAVAERLKREARAAARLNHPNVVTVYDWGTAVPDEPGQPPLHYIVMEYVDGVTLREVLDSEGRLDERTALQTAENIAAALDAAHRKGVVHRDVKPQNVMKNPDGDLKVTDFGIARAEGLSSLTETNAVYGTVFYMSPEQARRMPIDGRADLYSLGVLLFELLTGEVPFQGDSLVETAMQHVHDEPPTVRSLRPDVSTLTDALVRRALAKAPEQRFADAAEMRAALQRALAALPADRGAKPLAEVAQDTVKAKQVGEVQKRPEQRPPRRPPPARTAPVRKNDGGKRAAAWLMAAPLFLALLVAAFILAHGHQSAAPRPAATAITRHHGTTRGTSVRHHASPPKQAPAAPVSTAAPRSPAVAIPQRPAPKPVATRQSPAPTVTPVAGAGAPAVSASQAPAGRAGGGSPVATIQSFYQSVSRHQFDAAAQLWTAGMQTRNPPISSITQRFSATSSIYLRDFRIESLDQVNGQATVWVDVVEVDAGGGTSEYTGTWQLLREASAWLMDSENLTATHG